ncbi:MAG: DEAD/DEAH box helicase [Acetobacterales bacterium]
MGFDELGLSDNVLRAVGDAGYKHPTPIQEKAIPIVLMARDVLGCAQTGTGKTASFVLPILDVLASGRARARMPRCLILEPTRELAAQVAENFETYGKYQDLSMALLIGGTSFDKQEALLSRGVDVLIATPGRLIDMFERGGLILADTKILVIDEADRMMDMGFIPDVERIVSMLPPIRQTLFFSATMPPEIRRLADKFLSNPKEISVAPPSTPAATVDQSLIVVPSRDKEKVLRHLLENQPVKNALIFCNRKRDVASLERSLNRAGMDTAALHGDMSQPARTETLQKFRSDEVKILVCSDVAARGLDIQGLSHVFNYDVPQHAEDYIHRIGRTGRAGRPGRAFTIATASEGKEIAAIEKLIGKPIPRDAVEGSEPEDFSDWEEGKGRKRQRGGESEKKKPAKKAEKVPAESESRESKRESDKTDTPKTDSPKADSPKADSPKADSPKADSPKRERPTKDAPKTEARKPRRGRSRSAEREDDDAISEGPTPFGDAEQVPAFLRRPVPKRKSDKQNENV